MSTEENLLQVNCCEVEPEDNRYYQVFGRAPVILPVVHVINYEQARRNLVTISECGCQGAFLIDHSPHRDHVYLVRIWGKLKREFPGLWLGLNCLGASSFELSHIFPRNLDGLWTDDALIDEGPPAQYRARTLAINLQANYPQAVYFGGVAFKYQRPIAALAQVAQAAKPLVDIITTSGDATGVAADIGKVQQMRSAIGDHPLALASGITTRNIGRYLPYVNAFLVATSITDQASELIVAERLWDLLVAAGNL